MQNNIITIRNLNYSFKEQKIFNNLNLTIKRNSYISIIGPNGVGKSTLIKILIGLLPYEGYININNYYLNQENINKIRRCLGVILDEVDNQFIGETVIDDLAFNLENLSYSKEEIEKEITYITKIFNIEEYLYENPLSLKESTKHVIALATALIHKPSILILDEALNTLTPTDKEKIKKALSYYRDNHDLTIIQITHNTTDTLYADRVIVLNKGMVYLDDNPINVYSNTNKLKQLGIEIPFIIKLSHNLELYNLINKPYLNIESLVDKLW